jgi:hypothetical protein
MLLPVLLGLAFLIGNFYAYRWVAAKEEALQLQADELKADQADALVALQETEQWKQRQSWIDEKQPPLGDEGDAKASVLDHVQKGARANKLEILEQSLDDVQRTAGGTRVNVSVKVKGGMEDLVKWLTNLQRPDDFYAVTLFSLKADQDQKSFDCTLQIARFFKGGSSS